MNRVVRQHLRPDFTNDPVRQHATDNTIGVDDNEFVIDLFATLECRFSQIDEMIIQSPIQFVILLMNTVCTEKMFRFLGRCEHAGKVQALCLPMSHSLADDQRIHTANHFIDGSETEFRHDHAQLFGHHEKIVDDVLRLAGEFLAQLRVLRRNADRTRIEVTLAHHDAAQCDQWRGGETKLLRAQQYCNGDVPAGLDLTIRLQDNT